MQRARYLLPKGCRVLDQCRIVLVLSCGFLEGGLSRNHVEQDDTNGEHICFTRLVRKLEVDLWAHVVDRTHEGLRVLVEVGREDKVSDFQVEIVGCVDIQVLGLEVAVGEAFVLDGLQAVNELLKVVPGYWLWQATCL